eukprot:CAMPEP_0184317596 /NCGR_PEP_ID=MMETSP1049-20130417/97510_1 /TAXON_ID=77928 /ORGANISM="Proteomonas sulcata, Strain CCMP704" /LENGTH=72 /DNA_ID=CAMNT_0026637031 /DNA_START=112 /DNA_END=326 /DNA_ORIENTATION=-
MKSSDALSSSMSGSSSVCSTTTFPGEGPLLEDCLRIDIFLSQASSSAAKIASSSLEGRWDQGSLCILGNMVG